jgi:hypothetical protein
LGIEKLSDQAELSRRMMMIRLLQALTEELEKRRRDGVRPTSAQAHDVQRMASTYPLLSHNHDLCPIA